MAMRVREAIEDVDAEPPKPLGAKNKLAQSVQDEGPRPDNVVPFVLAGRSDDSWVETDLDRDLVKALREAAQRAERRVEYVEVPEEDPILPAQAQGASPAELDERARLNAWLELNCPINPKVFTLPDHMWTEDDWKEIDGVKWEAPRRMRRVRHKQEVQTPKGVRKKTRYELVPDDIIRHEVMREIKVSSLKGGRTTFVPQTLYSPLNNSPLRSPWNCSAAYFGDRYFTDTSYARYVRSVHRKNMEYNEKRRKQSSKPSPPPVLGARPVPNRTVAWMMRHPNGSVFRPEVPNTARIDPLAVRENFRQECIAFDVLQHMEQSQVDIESMMQESVLYHKSMPESGDWRDVKLPVQRPEINQGVREILQFFEESYEDVTSEGFDSSVTLDSEYLWAEANNPGYETEESGEVHTLPFSSESVKPEAFSPSKPAPRRTMAGYELDHVSLDNKDPFDLRHFKARQMAQSWQKLARELEQIGAAKGKQSESEEKPNRLIDGGMAVVRPDGYVLPANVDPDNHELLAKVAHAATCLYPQRLVLPELESCVRTDANTLELTVHGRTQVIDIRTQAGAYKLKRLVDTLSCTLNQLLDWETYTLVQHDMLPPDWKDYDVSFNPEPQSTDTQMASMRKMCLGDICSERYGHNVKTSFYREGSRGSVPWRHAKKNFSKMLRTAEALQDMPLMKAKARLLYLQIQKEEAQDQRLRENVNLWKWQAEQKRNGLIEREVEAIHRMGEPERRRRADRERLEALKKTPEFRAKLLADIQMIKRMRKQEPKVKTSWLRKFKSKFQPVYAKVASWKKSGATGFPVSNPPFVGNAPETQNREQQEVASPPKELKSVPRKEDSCDVIELNTEHMESAELVKYVTSEDGVELLNLRNQLAEQNELPVEYLDRELAKIYKPALHQNAQRRRANRSTLAKRLAA